MFAMQFSLFIKALSTCAYFVTLASVQQHEARCRYVGIAVACACCVCLCRKSLHRWRFTTLRFSCLLERRQH